jgi:mono/diheme cytochrome c family protein
MRSFTRVCTPVFLLCIVAAAPHAGGGAVITLDDVPDYIVAGQPVTLSWVARQHGEFVNLNYIGIATINGEKVPVERYGARFSATFTAKEEGPVHVSLMMVRPVASGPGGTSSVIFGSVRLLPIQAVAPGEAPPALPAAERGRRLFVAKGCATCHGHRAVNAGSSNKDLTGRSFGINYLADIINDPYSILPAPGSPYLAMPALGLSYQDAEFIGAFLRESARATK